MTSSRGNVVVCTHSWLVHTSTNLVYIGTYWVCTCFLSMPILRISRLWQTSPTTRMCSCAFYASMLGENLQDQLGFPDKADQRAAPGTGWTPAELNHILHVHVVDCTLTTFGCVEWESQLFRGTMRARCYPFNLPKRRFHSFNPKVRTCIQMM